MKVRRFWIPLVAMAALVSGCGPRIADEFEEPWSITQSKIETTRKMIESFESRVAQQKKAADIGQVISELEISEKFKDAFANAKRDVGIAEKAFKEKLTPIAKKDSPENRVAFAKELGQIELLLTSAQNAAKRPKHLTDLVSQARTSATDMAETARGWASELSADLSTARPIVAEAQRKHAAKKDDLAARLATLEDFSEKAAKNADAVAKAGAANKLGAFAVGHEAVENAHLLGSAYAKDLVARAGQLDREYTKTLVDMRAEYYVTFGRSSWNNQSDFGGETDIVYPPTLVSASQYITYLRNPNNVTPAGINTYEDLPSSHDGTEFWVSDTDEKFFHKYLIVENGKSTNTDWVSVEDDEFYLNVENLGMDILYKPFGKYEDEASEEATPIGYAYVGNPRYGSWTNGIWTWLPAYMFFNSFYGGRSYMRSDWDDWNRNYRGRRSYYGPRRDNENTYGTYGAYGRTYFGGTTWARTGGLNRQDASIRGLAQSFRGGGPGGGGK